MSCAGKLSEEEIFCTILRALIPILFQFLWLINFKAIRAKVVMSVPVMLKLSSVYIGKTFTSPKLMLFLKEKTIALLNCRILHFR